MRFSAAPPEAHGGPRASAGRSSHVASRSADALVEGLLPTACSQPDAPKTEQWPSQKACLLATCDELARQASLTSLDHLTPCMLGRLLATTFPPRGASVLSALAS